MIQKEYIKQLIQFKPELTTKEVVKYLNHKSYHAGALRRPENKLKLGAKRNGKRNLVFCTHRVFELKLRISQIP